MLILNFLTKHTAFASIMPLSRFLITLLKRGWSF